MRGVKICGINTPEALDAAVAARADYVGFVFFAPSPRAVTAEFARVLTASLPADGPKRVGLFVRPTAEEVACVLRVVPLDTLQLYDADIPAIRAFTSLPLWRAHGVSTASDLPRGADGADALVIEAKPPAGASRPGGLGLTIDWPVLRGWDAPVPWMLAGGLTPDNVAAAIAASGACAVDVSSGVESAPGVKTPALIAAFAHAARLAFGETVAPRPSRKGRGEESPLSP